MIHRSYWKNQIEECWKQHSIIWLAGIRRVGKTFLSKSLENICYFDCELPSVRRQLDDTESFLEDMSGKRVVLDEIHRLDNPSEILKICADHYPDVKIIATGSSTLGASSKFKDTLTGRKADLLLLPIIMEDLLLFGKSDLKYRFLRGGLPEFFNAEKILLNEFSDWMDAYWAKDIQELFRLERRSSFLRFVELLMIKSSGIFEAIRFAKECEVSNNTIKNYLAILEATFIAHVIRPYNTRKAKEIIKAPKVYGFDTGFVCFYKGWESLREEDCGLLWEHFVLNEMQAKLQTRGIQYWRDKSHHEIDFIIKHPGSSITAIECKWNTKRFSVKNLSIFRKLYPEGLNCIVGHDIKKSFRQNINGIELHFVNLDGLINLLADKAISKI